MVTGIDLIELMLRLGAREPFDWGMLNRPPRGAAIEVRLYAENPIRNFQPSPGTLTDVYFPDDARVDTWVETGTEVGTFFDPMLAKLIVHGSTREEARFKLVGALARTRLHGISTNLDYLRAIVDDPNFAGGAVDTGFLDRFSFNPRAIEVLEPGIYTTVQDYPGRLGFWSVGVPPSGPMDDYAFRLANRIVGNSSDAAGLECTLCGPTLRFHRDATVCITGALLQRNSMAGRFPCGPPYPSRLGRNSLWEASLQDAGPTWQCATASTSHAISAAAPRLCWGNLAATQDELFASATCCLSAIRTHLLLSRHPSILLRGRSSELIPDYSSPWRISMLHGPHSAPDYFTHEAIESFFQTEWEAHYNSNRLGIRLTGMKSSGSRELGGAAGLHPSNVHDCVYAIGSINFTGDTPVILTRDGPSLGGFVCPGYHRQRRTMEGRTDQTRGSDSLRSDRSRPSRGTRSSPGSSHPYSYGSAAFPCANSGNRPFASGGNPRQSGRAKASPASSLETKQEIAAFSSNTAKTSSILALRLRVHLLMETIRAEKSPVLELSPGVRSLQIRYHSGRVSQSKLLRRLYEMEDQLPSVASLKIPTRVVRLPMAFQDSTTLSAIARYSETVRSTAPWLPSNAEFLRRINGLGSVQEVRDIIFSARYMVLGLGDVYLGAPCAVPVDPRHRLLGSKYNPARTFTAEGTVGIGGMYMCASTAWILPEDINSWDGPFLSGTSSLKIQSSQPISLGYFVSSTR